jgi:hypothetical protein
MSVKAKVIQIKRWPVLAAVYGYLAGVGGLPGKRGVKDGNLRAEDRRAGTVFQDVFS